MELNRPANPNKWTTKLVVGIGKKLRSDKQYSEAVVQEKRKKESAKLQKKSLRPATTKAPEVNDLGERIDYAVYDTAGATTLEAASKKKTDYGDTLHRLAHYESDESLLEEKGMREALRDPFFDSRVKRKRIAILVSEEHERRISSIPDELWKYIANFLNPMDAANLSLSTKTLQRKLGTLPAQVLNHPDNKHHKIKFLRQDEHNLPDYLLCFACARYHRRLAPGKEVLRMDYVANPVVLCPKVRESVLPRMRLVHGRELPYSFVQLALRHASLGPEFGISYDGLSRRWKCKDSTWTHRTRYMIHDGRLLLRVVSQTPTPPASQLTETAERHLLYDREEYTPFFSVCAHWRDGDLTKICKCMMSHVPAPPDPYYKQLQRGFKVSRTAAHPDFIVRGCDECRPARRCPECPTEYLVEVQMVEDPKDREFPFKHTLTVTRWSDLGDGSSPFTSREWVAINGLRSANPSAYDSFSNIGRRAVGGIFESHVSGANPGQRLISLNPSNKKLGEEGNGWY